MLKKVTLKNFMSHPDSTVEFSPGVNVFIGKSDAGKSVVLQLIDWIRTNRPLGDAFRSEWGGDTEGQIWTTDNQTIKRVRTDKENYYQINKNKPLKAFGQNPPEVVQEILAMDEFNIQSQGETPFLLGKPLWTPGEVSKVLNQAASLEDIDVSTRNLTSGYNSAKREIQRSEGLLEDQKQELKKYQNLQELENQIVELEHLERHRNTLAGQRNALYNLSQEITHIKVRLKKTEHLRQAKELLSGALKIREKQKKLVLEFDNLSNLQSDILGVKEQVKNLDAQIANLQQEYDELVPDACPLCGGPMKERRER